jgi:hypothetical protein
MSNWTQGYVAEIDYTHGYFHELNPHRATLAFLAAGYAPPSNGVHCELGYGQGLSINILASGSDATWYGTDFNPSQAAFAKSLAAASGAKAHLTDETFTDFCSRSDLPDFDSIGLHGIWSWISHENRAVIVDFIRRKLKVGGALYISYNTLPGWATFAPMRHLLTEHASVLGSTGEGAVNRIEGALQFAQKLLDTNPLFSRANPSLHDRFKKLTEQNRHYLAHEYFNKDWHPMHFADTSKWLRDAKVDFACSAHYLDHIETINLTPEQQAMVGNFTDITFKQTVRDFMVNAQFRKDYWLKGPRKLSAVKLEELIKQQKVLLVTPRIDVPMKINAELGEVRLSDAVYAPILDLLSGHQIKSIEELTSRVQKKSVTFAQVVQAIILLIGSGHVEPVLENQNLTIAKNSTKKLNLALLDKARFGNEISFLASPVTGGGIAVNRFQQLFLLAMTKGKQQPQEWAEMAWSILSTQNQRLLKDGKTIESVEETIQELNRQAKDFATKRMQILKALEVV